MASASRTAGWSSTIRTLAGFLMLFRLMVLPCQGTCYHGASGLRRLDGQSRTDDRGTVAHDAQPQSVVVLGRLVWDADAVILHAQHQDVIRLHGNANVLAPGVLDGVVDRFLGDEIEVGRNEIVFDEDRLGALKDAS